MSNRVATTVSLSVAFIALIVTGILMYATPYDRFTSSLHLWSSILVLASIGFHIYNNWKPYKSHLKKKLGKWVFISVGLSIIPISVGLILEVAPFNSVVSFGEKLRKASTVRDGSFTTIDLTKEQKGKRLELFVKAGSAYESEPQPLFLGITYTSTPQLAVWLESTDGQYIRTLYVTNKLSNSSFRSTSGDEVVRRPEALPYWSHKRGVKAEDGLFVPDAGSTEFDGYTAATPQGDHQLYMPSVMSGQFKLMVETSNW